MMKRNGLVFVPPESPKRVILYPTQDSTNHPQPSAQQQQPIVNGFQSRPKTALITNSQNDPTTSINANNNARLLQPHPHSSPPKPSEKTHADEGSNAASRNPSQRTVNPYYANPFFRPKILTNQSGTTTNPSLAPTSNRESTVITTTVPLQQQQPTTPNPIVNGTRSMIYPKPATSNSLNNGRLVDSDSTFATAPSNQEESRRWAHSVAPTSIAQRVLNDERPNTTMHSSTNNITNAANGETGMHKHTSATDIVISLMDPLRPPLNTPGASVMNILARRVTIKDDSAIPETSATTTANNGTTAASPPANNQNWRKALLANFQKNSRNIPTSKIFQTKHNPPAVAPPPTNANDPSVAQPTRPERSMILNNNNSERTFQASDTAPPIPFLMRKSTESLRVTKQETANATNSNNHSTMNSTTNATIERSTSLQVPMSSVTNGTTDATLSASNTAETVKPKESSNPEPTSHPTISIPSALITGKPTVSVEQQRAIITRVMIRRDFVKSTESKPPMPSSANPRLMMTAQANRANGLPSNETNQLDANGDTRNASPAMANPVRMYQPNQNQIHLSQKSLLQFNPVHSAMRESMRVDHPYPHPSHAQQQSAQQFQHQQLQQQPQQPQQQQQQSSPQVNQSVTRERISSASTARVPLAQTGSVNPAGFRSISLSATNAEMKRKKEELFNKAKKRAASASAVSNDGTLEKDPFEIEDEEYEAELEEESVRSSESDVENDASVSLDPAVLLSDKTRRLGNAEVKPGFIPSLFSNVPPTIRFCTENQRIEQLPAPLRKMMKWKMSSITPNIVKNTVIRSGFRLISGDEGNDWLGTWSRHMKPVCFKAIREYQKVNHFPGSFQIGRKDRLWRNLSHMQAVHSRREFDFVPQTFVLPADFLLFKRVFDEITDAKESKWIIKPPASARGQGIRVISKIEHVPKKRPVIVQKYIANPYLINGHKFDLRLYVYVTSHDPLRIYLFDDGLTRFASRKYSSSVKSLSDRFMHLTNYSINRYNSEYRTNNDSGACTGHKWSLKALWTYLKKRDLDVAEILERIKDLIIKTIISADAYVNVLTKANVRRKYSVHELFGFDVILDEHCKPYIVEVNISPSLHSNSPLDISVKGAMICDLLNLSGFMIPDRRDILFDGSARRKPKLPKSLIFDRRVLPQALSSDEKLKHQYFTQRYHDEQARRNILDVLTPDDLRILIETEDEFARRGSFERIFPTHQTRKYLKYFETPRYYNLLLNEWIAKYHRMEERGIALLNSCCKKGIHLQHPATDNNHIWAHYQKLQGHLSHRDNDNTNGNGS